MPLDAVARLNLAGIGERRRCCSASGRPTSWSARPASCSSPASVFLVEPVGPVTYVDVDLDGPTFKATCDPDQAPAAGDHVTLGFAAGRVRLFDPPARTGSD